MFPVAPGSMLPRPAQMILRLLAACQDRNGMTETELQQWAIRVSLSPVGLDAGLNELEDRHLIEGDQKGGQLAYKITASGQEKAARLTIV